jgi:uncharacterized membrane protein
MHVSCAAIDDDREMNENGAGDEVIESIRRLAEWAALSIEVLAVVVIMSAVVLATTPRGWLGLRAARPLDAFSGYKQRMGRGLLLGLELLLAADIIGTIASTPTLESLAALGLLAVIRSFLSWSLEVEIEGCWPWQAQAERRRRPEQTTAADAPNE